MEYKITVITVVFNDVANIRNTISSVINQTYKNIEYIIIDGNSKDGTIDIIKEYTDRVSKFVSEPDKGIYDAMNKGLIMASGDYVIFMNSGDIFINEFVLEGVMNGLKGFPDIIYGHTISKYKNGRLRQALSPFFESKAYCPSVGICHQSVFVKTIKAKDVLFDLSYKVCADHKMLYELYRSGATTYEYKGDIAEIICGEGYSDKHLYLKLNERGRIYGIDKDIKFKFFLLKSFFHNWIHSLFRLIEPSNFRNYRFRHKKDAV